MVLRKERSTPSEGNISSSLPASSSTSSSSRIMSNEQPVTKRQRIDNRNVTGDSGSNSMTTASMTTTTTVSSTPSSSSSSSTSSSSSSLLLKDEQEITPDILVRPSTSTITTAASTVGVSCNSSLSENHNSSSSSSINSNNTSSNVNQDEVDRVGNQEMIPDLLRLNTVLTNCENGNGSSNSNNSSNSTNDIREFEEYLMKQCLCNVNERILRRLLQDYYQIYDPTQDEQHHQSQNITMSAATPLHLYELPTNKLIQFLSNLQLLFDIYLKQNTKGFICNRIMEICNILIQNDIEMIHQYNSYHHSSHLYHHPHHHHRRHHHSNYYHPYNNFQYSLIDEIIELNNYHNKYVQFLSIKVLSSFLVISKNHNMIDNWLKKLVDNLFVFDEHHLNYNAVKKINFSLEIIKRIVEWKDIDIHPLDDDDDGENDNDDEEDDNNHDGGSGGGENDHHDNGDFDDERRIISGRYRNAGISLLPQQPLLENNYFARHYNNEVQASVGGGGASTSSNNDGNGGGSGLDRMNLLLSSSNSNSNSNNNGRLKKRRQQQMMMTVEQNENYETVNLNNSRNHHHGSAGGGENSGNNVNGGSSNSSSGDGENDNDSNGGGGNRNHNTRINCQLITLTDSESFDTTQLKCLTIKILENKWPALVKNMSTLIQSRQTIDISENCILTFLLLWENIISVKANLSIIETLPFYSQLDKFEILLLNSNLSCLIYKQMLNLFNEALCYGSTLALQDLLPEETCQLAHQIVRHVKDYRILDSLPRRKIENNISFIGYRGKIINYDDNDGIILTRSYNHHHHQHHPDDGTDTEDDNDGVDDEDDDDNRSNLSPSSSVDMDKTILQKMVLLILKSIAVTVKEIRSDSSDSSIDSQDYDAFQDMILIERSIRDVLKKLELFIKQQLEFHPECHFSKILIHLFDDQDDSLIEAMVCTLDVTSGISFRNNAFPELVAMLNPVYTFLEFLKMISNSTDLLLDLLVSNETCFLLYLLRFLKYIRLNWSMFVASCHEFNGSGSGSSYRLPFITSSSSSHSHHHHQQIVGLASSSSSLSSSGLVVGGGTTGSNTTLDDAMSVLIRLRLQISRLVSKSLYPYDISPVLRLLESCESLYEGNELS